MDWDQQQQGQQRYYRSQSVSIPASRFPGPSQYADYGQQQYERRNPPASYPPQLPPLQVNPSAYLESDTRNLPSSAVPPHVRGGRRRAQSVPLTSIGQREQRAYASSPYARYPYKATVLINRSLQQQWPVQYPPDAQVPYISSVMSPDAHPPSSHVPSRVMPPLSELDRRTLPPVREALSRPKPHVCDQCGRAFSRAHDLKRHIETHKGDRPHKCPTCTKAFSRGGALRRHQSMAQCGVVQDVDEAPQGSLVSGLPGSITPRALIDSFARTQLECHLFPLDKATGLGYNEVRDPPYRLGTSASKSVATIKSGMQTSEVMQHLVEHGCQDITTDVELDGSSGAPTDWGGSGCIYVMKLRNGTEVAVKCLSKLGDLDASDKHCKVLKNANLLMLVG